MTKSLQWSGLALLLIWSITHDGFAQNLSANPKVVHEERQVLAMDMANSVLSIISDPKAAKRDREYALSQGFANVVDIEWIAKFVLGASWRNATEEQKHRYTELYRAYLTKIYVSHYAGTSDSKIKGIKVLGIKDDEKDFTAFTEIMLTNNDKLKVDYLVSERGEGYKITDVIIQGVSLLNTHRAEFSALAASKGVSGVIARLEQLV
jgi:phospholipid transport system substrate-binding protein